MLKWIGVLNSFSVAHLVRTNAKDEDNVSVMD